MDYAHTTSGSFYRETIDRAFFSDSIISTEEQIKRLYGVKNQHMDDKYKVVLKDGSLYYKPKTNRWKFSFDTAETIVETLAEQGIKAESVKID